jgi:hypothetical protein
MAWPSEELSTGAFYAILCRKGCVHPHTTLAALARVIKQTNKHSPGSGLAFITHRARNHGLAQRCAQPYGGRHDPPQQAPHSHNVGPVVPIPKHAADGA